MEIRDEKESVARNKEEIKEGVGGERERQRGREEERQVKRKAKEEKGQGG